MKNRAAAARIVEWQARQRAAVELGREYAERVAFEADAVVGPWAPPVSTSKALEGRVNAIGGQTFFEELICQADCAAALRWQALIALYAMQLEGVHA